MIDYNKVISLTWEGEKWKPIPNYPNYLISNLGRLYSGKYNRINKGEINKRGYRIYELYSDNYPNGKKFRACRLVAQAFCQGYAPEMEIHHCNLCPCDDRASNLLPVTHEQHGIIHKAIDRFILALCEMLEQYKCSNLGGEVAA